MLRVYPVLTRITRVSVFSRTFGYRAFSSAPTKDCYIEHLEGDDKGISVLSLNRPAAKNAISRKLLNEFQEALQELRFGDTRVVILRSLVDGVFCAGADLKERATMTPPEVTKFLTQLRQSFRDLETLPIPTIASIDGAALGGGLEMALCCDLRVAGSGAKLGLPETKLAIIPGAGGTQRLPRLIGISQAKELIYTARVLNNKEAAEYAIVNHAVDSSYEKSLSIARAILPQGPVAIRMAKRSIDCGTQFDIDSGLDTEQLCYAQVIPTQDRLEGLRAFKEKRKPVYKGN
ncbi:enoyl-CoA hydratase/isomerase domain-containing protein [Basidiobolus meristosporus CBS 931.73]|uniref:Enoyl-CoA hydratase/isomerase domain-containing protein n=1 Tax=Basidiobolus meristosporus CBS 931.73 TaxID=1314790 RepID=A0A1Y1ZDQ5_9FUNG|nr:enoyl-CoA hydratase/isomerase domain-containing protein [Basidiobolus meristosporus CBS 931.73]|eukprot:ORY08314.1 enoyl-CoA hydratase/isomerase domain-containing protein [Basidiobolus meristosporus CBS 931.73]